MRYGLVYVMLFLCIQQQDCVFQDLVLKTVDLNHSKDLLTFGRILDSYCRVMHH
jgi:hypothetical protein